jgi:TRAP-type C4-dicarboxylate transport system substrate-binding protein
MGGATMKKAIIIFIALFLVASPWLGIAAQEKSKPIVLKAVTMVREGHETRAGFEMYVKRLHEKTRGEITINIIGGPEAIDYDSQAEAVRSGVVDVYGGASGRLMAIIPEILTLEVSELTPSEERKVGYYDFMNQLFNKVGLFYIGRTWMNYPFYLWTNVEVKKLGDLSGLKFRGTPFYHPVMRPFGIVPVAMPLEDIYEAMGRRIVDGWAASPNTAIDSKLYEVTKYCIDQPFWGAGNFMAIVNLKAWNRVPKHLQQLMVDVMAEMEPEIGTYYKNSFEGTMKKLKDYGMKFVKFSPADAKRFDEEVARAKWESILKGSPENIAKIRKMITKTK